MEGPRGKRFQMLSLTCPSGIEPSIRRADSLFWGIHGEHPKRNAKPHKYPMEGHVKNIFEVSSGRRPARLGVFPGCGVESRRREQWCDDERFSTRRSHAAATQLEIMGAWEL